MSRLDKLKPVFLPKKPGKPQVILVTRAPTPKVKEVKPKLTKKRIKELLPLTVDMLNASTRTKQKNLKMSDKKMQYILDLLHDGYSDSETAVHAKTQSQYVMQLRLAAVEHKGRQNQEPSDKPKKSGKVNSGSFGQPNSKPWQKMCDNLDADGLPIPPAGIGRPKGTVDITKFLNKLSKYSKPEIEHIIEYRSLDGQSLSIQAISYAQLFLDTMHEDPNVRRQALKLVTDRRFGTSTVKLANGDGSNLNPLTMLIDQSKAKLQPNDE